jgi:hypothetical protein
MVLNTVLRFDSHTEISLSKQMGSFLPIIVTDHYSKYFSAIMNGSWVDFQSLEVGTNKGQIFGKWHKMLATGHIHARTALTDTLIFVSVRVREREACVCERGVCVRECVCVCA